MIMKRGEGQLILSRIRNQWKFYKFIETVLKTAGLTFVLSGILNFILDLERLEIIGLSFLVFIFLLVLMLLMSGFARVRVADIARYLNRSYPQMQESTELVIDGNETTGLLAGLQRQRVLQQLRAYENEIKIPHKILPAFALFFVCLGSAYFLWHIQAAKSVSQQDFFKTSETVQTKDTISEVLPPELKEAMFTIQPPAYTGLPAKKGAGLELEAVEGSLITWNFQFTDTISEAFLVFSSEDSLKLGKNKKCFYQGNKVVTDTEIYTYSFTARSNTIVSDFYRIDVKKDQKPEVLIKGRDQYTDMIFYPEAAIEVKAEANDDYGVTESYIIATVSKGSGENVKFREERFDFMLPESHRKSNQFSKIFMLQELGMEPGDELYFYVEAWDNHQPNRQRNRTEMYFVALEDTTTSTLSISAGLGVNQMPEYFRSQRQIIIDTEKLVREQVDLAEDKFNQRSNALGADQKILRLRYGQFLGEEFESNVVQAHADEVERISAEGKDDVSEEVEHHLHDGHTHSEDEFRNEQPIMGEIGNDLENYVHAHDATEEATFFDEALKVKLKAALAQMWEAELRLRMHQPQKALPFEYKALELIKEIQQSSRVYVEKVGFEPPPLKPAETRLTGDLDDISHLRSSTDYEVEISYPFTRLAVPLLENIILENRKIQPKEKEILLMAGQEMAEAAISLPEISLTALNNLKRLASDETPVSAQQAIIPMVQKTLIQILPEKPLDPGKINEKKSRLSRLFIEEAGGIE